MRNRVLLTACLAAATTISAFAQAKPSVGSVELSDAAGDVGPIRTMTTGPSGNSERNFPGFDVIKLSMASDGQQITIAATLNSPPAAVAASVLEIYVDTDNSPRTGAAVDYTSFAGFEFKGSLDACLALSDSADSCAGASATPSARVVRRYAIVRLDRFKGAKASDGVEEVVDARGFFAPVRAPQTPIVGPVVQASLAYDALKVVSGRTIRLVVRETSAHPTPTGTPQGFFPEVRLTLK